MQGNSEILCFRPAFFPYIFCTNVNDPSKIKDIRRERKYVKFPKKAVVPDQLVQCKIGWIPFFFFLRGASPHDAPMPGKTAGPEARWSPSVWHDCLVAVEYSQGQIKWRKMRLGSLQSLPFVIIGNCLLVLIGSFGCISRVKQRMDITGHAGPSSGRQGRFLPGISRSTERPAIISTEHRRRGCVPTDRRGMMAGTLRGAARCTHFVLGQDVSHLLLA